MNRPTLKDLGGLPSQLRSQLGSGVAARVGERRSLRSRVEELEAAVQENRQLNLRIAELSDVMMELVLPLEERDEAKVAEAVARFRESLGGPAE